MRLRVITLLMVALFFSAADETHADEIDRYVQTQMERQHVPGLSLVIVRGGRVVKQRGYGFADLERRVPASADTVYEIGSITKQFTSMAVMLLRERGRLALEDPLGKFLTDIPEVWKPLTIRHLLSHTSGVPDYEEVMGYDSYRNPMTPEQVFAFVAAKPLDFPPGTRWKYSNTGYFLLTRVIEKISGQPYAEFVTANILVPAGMTHTRSSEPGDVIPNRAAGYEYQKVLRNRDAIQPTATGGAGMLVSTVGDMARWISAVIAKRAILTPESYALTFTDMPLADGSHAGYGFGWFVTPMRGHRALSHAGGTAGFTCNLLYLPDDDVTIIVLINSGTANPLNFTDHFARAMVPALRYTAIPDSRPEIGRQVLDYFSHRTNDEPYLSPLATELAEQTAPYWSTNVDYYKLLGPPLGIELVEQVPDEGALRYRVRYRDGARIVLVKTDGTGKLSELAGSEE